MKRIISTGFLVIMLLWNLSCKDYLNIVPDDTIILEDYFARKEMAWNTLTKVYSYLPPDPMRHNTSWSLGDEWMGRIDYDNTASNLVAMRVMRGLQNSTTPLLGLWSGTGGGTNLYQGIRTANIFLEYIDLAEDMTETELAEWKAQVKFLKAYYHFLLVRQYGPVVIVDRSLPLNASSDELFQRRSKVEDCLNFIIGLMDEAIPDLKEKADLNDLGQVDRVIAMAIKARVMLFRASPFLNGNKEFYGDFFDHNGEPFFPLEYKVEKWKDALDAVNAAIELCENNGFGLYTYDKSPYIFDRDDYAANTANMQTLYNLRMLIVDPWNKELVWGQTYNYSSDGTLAVGCSIRLPLGYGDGLANSGSYSAQWVCATYKMLERYYTKNGLPPDEDRTFDRDAMYEVITTPGVSDTLAYEPLQGIMQPGAEAINLYMNREPRFYANLGITGGYWRAHSVRINTMMYAGADGGYNASISTGEYLCTGIGIQKFVHPESRSGNYTRIVRFPYPIIRMADLYLMKAEILNEYSGPDAEVYEAINKVRRRAGIPDVEVAWSDAAFVRAEFLGKHLTKEGMREIILYERSVELAFEGSRFWDMHRYKRASAEFSSPVMGWDYTGYDANTFFMLNVKQSRRYLFRDYLWPVSLDETNTNSNIIQNPGW